MTHVFAIQGLEALLWAIGQKPVFDRETVRRKFACGMDQEARSEGSGWVGKVNDCHIQLESECFMQRHPRMDVHIWNANQEAEEGVL